MTEKALSIYVSAAPEMDRECELLGQLLAGMVHSVRWTIRRTPRPYEDGNPDLEALRTSTAYLILLGGDIMAPIGVEWQAARAAGVSTLAYRNMDRLPTPATAFFAHNMSIPWEGYSTPEEFVRRFEEALVRLLLNSSPGLGLDTDDIMELSGRLRALVGRSEDERELDQRRGAGRGGVILPEQPR